MLIRPAILKIRQTDRQGGTERFGEIPKNEVAKVKTSRRMGGGKRVVAFARIKQGPKPEGSGIRFFLEGQRVRGSASEGLASASLRAAVHAVRCSLD